jgi:hypothetical protein
MAEPSRLNSFVFLPVATRNTVLMRVATRGKLICSEITVHGQRSAKGMHAAAGAAHASSRSVDAAACVVTVLNKDRPAAHTAPSSDGLSSGRRTRGNTGVGSRLSDLGQHGVRSHTQAEQE